MLAAFSSSLPPSQSSLRQELLGEAIVEMGNASGSDKLVAAGYVSLALALQGRLDAAKAILQEVWEQSPELQDQLAAGDRQHNRAVARIFAPKLTWVDPEMAFEIIPLLADQNEVDGLTSQAIVLLSLEDPELAFRLASARGIDLGSGVQSLFTYGGSRFCRDPSLKTWLAQLAQELPPSAEQAKLLVSVARHLPAGEERLDLFRRAASSWRDAQVDFWYHWSDPGKGVLEALSGFHDLRAAELDELIFASLAKGPGAFDSYNPLSVLANSARLLAIRDPALADRMLDLILEDCNWMFVHDRLTLDNNLIVAAAAWGNPYHALQMVQKLEHRLAADDDAIRLQLRCALVEGIKAVIDCRGPPVH